MNFKEGQRVQLNTFGKPVDGRDVQVEGTITKLTHGHAIMRFNSITEGARIAVKPSGEIHLLAAKEKLEPDWNLLTIGDIEAVPLADISPVEESKPTPEWITRELAEHWMGKYSNQIDSFIESGTIKQSIEGLLRAADIGWLRAALPTYEANSAKEHQKFGDEAKEFNRLGSQLHPEIFGKAW